MSLTVQPLLELLRTKTQKERLRFTVRGDVGDGNHAAQRHDVQAVLLRLLQLRQPVVDGTRMP